MQSLACILSMLGCYLCKEGSSRLRVGGVEKEWFGERVVWHFGLSGFGLKGCWVSFVQLGSDKDLRRGRPFRGELASGVERQPSRSWPRSYADPWQA